MRSQLIGELPVSSVNVVVESNVASLRTDDLGRSRSGGGHRANRGSRGAKAGLARSSGQGAQDCRAQRRTVLARMDRDRFFENVRIDLNDERIVMGQPAGGDQFLHGHASFLQYIDKSPVGNWIGHFTQSARATGTGRLALKLDIPLGKYEEARINGEYAFASLPNGFYQVKEIEDAVAYYASHGTTTAHDAAIKSQGQLALFRAQGAEVAHRRDEAAEPGAAAPRVLR